MLIGYLIADYGQSKMTIECSSPLASSPSLALAKLRCPNTTARVCGFQSTSNYGPIRVIAVGTANIATKAHESGA